ncbi:calmodulin-related [Lithospermum erythrorhizon]|uniref:Calmodulin-related n=1 Tax=Lithospermum erythrorhizon TaxID=34254 RepID=A0AAV3QE49_LITER
MKINMNYLGQLPIENLSVINTFPLAILLIGVVDFLLFNSSLDLGKKVYNLFSGSSSSAPSDKSQVIVSKNSCEPQEENKNQDLGLSQNKKSLNDAEQVYCRGEDIEIVMKSLCIYCKQHEKLNSDDMLNIFEEEKPMFDELKEAFDLFDENRDGFIDAEDLQRVLLALGFNEGLELENCMKMIRAFDENNDERIDFDEFLRFMENNEF